MVKFFVLYFSSLLQGKVFYTGIPFSTVGLGFLCWDFFTSAKLRFSMPGLELNVICCRGYYCVMVNVMIYGECYD